MDSCASVVTVVMLCVAFACARPLYEGDTCRLNDGSSGVCTTVVGCPGSRQQLIRGPHPPICSFPNNLPIVCCSDPTTVTKSRAIRQTNATVTNVLGSLVDRNTKTGRKCIEYARYVYKEVRIPTLSIIPEIYNQSDCSMVASTLIVGGVEAIPKEFPHMAALGYGSEDNVQWQCGGTLISERFVLTAAHCLSTQDGDDVRWVRLGDLNLYSDEDDARPITMAVAERIKHEEYRPPAHYNDIALLKLERDVTFSPYIRPACLYTRPGNPAGKVSATASGWGKLEYTEVEGSDNLMKVDLQLRDASRCNRTYRHEMREGGNLRLGITPESMICAGDPKGEKDTCGGDSGGPLQIRLAAPDPFCMYSVIGLTSFGVFACGLGDQPAVYTRISNYIPWIERHVWP